MIIGINKKLRPVDWISKNTWNKLKKKEKVYLLLKYSKKSYTKSQYMDILYLEDNSSYWRFLKRLNNKLKPDIEKIKQS